MQRVPCPFCGTRDEQEFATGGEADRVRPTLTASDEEWVRYLYFRENRKGVITERWHHVFGCRRWLNVVRDNVTHEILEVCGLHVPPPQLSNKSEYL